MIGRTDAESSCNRSPILPRDKDDVKFWRKDEENGREREWLFMFTTASRNNIVLLYLEENLVLKLLIKCALLSLGSIFL